MKRDFQPSENRTAETKENVSGNAKIAPPYAKSYRIIFPTLFSRF